MSITLNVNGQTYQLEVDPDTPLQYVLRNDLGLKSPKIGCGLEQCGACSVLIDGVAAPSCHVKVSAVQGQEIVTVEGLGTADALHPLQETFIEEQAIQCGYCASGMLIAAQGLLNQVRYPTDDQIKEALAGNLCRCGVHDRVRRAIKLRIGRPDPGERLEVRQGDFDLNSVQPGLPMSLERTPDLDAWIRINTDETITVFPGKVEIGQGSKTAFTQLAAEELDVTVERVQIVMADTEQTPDEGLTVGSMSMETTGNALRYAAAEARHFLLSIAYEELETPLERLEVSDGTIRDPESGRSTTYWDLMGGKKFGVTVSGANSPKTPDQYQVLGQAVQRVDLVDKVTGAACYLHDLDLPEMVHARLVRPPSYHAKLISADIGAIAKLPGVLKVVRDGSFLGVIAEREEQAVRAMEALAETAEWENDLSLPDQDFLYDYMLNQPVQSFHIVGGAPVEGPVPPKKTPKNVEKTVKSTYAKPYHMHASVGPSAAVAHMLDGKLTVWLHSQGVFPPRAGIAHVLGMAEEDIRTIYVDGPGCYGHNGADDAALDAALLARAFPGRPVSLKWTREQEHTWEPYGPSMVMQMEASLDAKGELLDWNHEVWSYPHLGRGGNEGDMSGLVASWHLADPFTRPPYRPAMWSHVGGHRNADPIYKFPATRIVKHTSVDSPLRVSALRALGAYGNIFAIEAFLDELAFAAGTDPIKFRLKYLDDQRGRDVLQAAAEKADWEGYKAEKQDGYGQGVAFSQYKNRAAYAAVIVRLHVSRETGEIRLQDVVIAGDSGQIINPDGIANQFEGGFMQAASMALKEEVKFSKERITSVDWETYPILTFPEAPRIETVLINRPGAPFMGSGEGTQGPAPAAIANAVFDAVGVRLRKIPFTPDKVLAALQEAGN